MYVVTICDILTESILSKRVHIFYIPSPNANSPHDSKNTATGI